MSELNGLCQCKHEELACRLRQHMGRAAATPVLQCLTCGLQVGGVKDSDPRAFEAKKRKLNGDLSVMFDDTLYRKWCASRMMAYEKVREEENQEWWEQYNAHLETIGWKRRRDQVIQRDRGICQGCLERPATQAHHLTYATYKRLGIELLFELIAVCDQCHRLLHPHMPEVVEVKLGRR